MINPELINIDTTILCDGDSVVFNSNVYNTTGYYIDTLTSYAGCDSLDILLLNVSPPITLLDTVIVNDNGNMTGSIDLVLANLGQNYTYIWSNGAMTPFISNLFAFNYTVTIVDGLGCNTSFMFTVDLDVSTEKQELLDYNVQVLPNPIKVNENISIKLKTEQSDRLLISVFSSTGQVVQSVNRKISRGENKIQIPAMDSCGLFYIIIQNEEGIVIKSLPLEVFR